ncbi:zinc finger, CCHC-type containing protein [Tanacetum coccineum]
MDPKAPNNTNTVDDYDIYFQDDAEQYMWGYGAYEQFLAMKEAEQQLIDDYFGEDDTPHKYPEEKFRPRYRMSSTLFAKIVNDLTNYDAEPLPGSIDCMHWKWKNCPKALHEEFKRRYHKYSTLILEAVTDKKIVDLACIFEVPRAINDLNVLYGFPLFDDVLADTAPEVPFVVNGRTYKKGYYLADGIIQHGLRLSKHFLLQGTKNLEV